MSPMPQTPRSLGFRPTAAPAGYSRAPRRSAAHGQHGSVRIADQSRRVNVQVRSKLANADRGQPVCDAPSSRRCAGIAIAGCWYRDRLQPLLPRAQGVEGGQDRLDGRLVQLP